ncbi:DUF4350 domain-containing protein [Gordonia soli]|uniref:DUF4350 domain-containing protein n=1 Tax=Gordonia soli TaxID=320799 RepID=UPI001FE071BD|nr:DUF4350 domain-containing protein [Gordonia soli]
MAVVIVALIGIALTIAAGQTQKESAYLDPSNPDGNGAQALASVIDDKGVGVDVVRDQDALFDAPRPGADTTVVVTSASELSSMTADRFWARVSGARRVVVVGAYSNTLSTMDIPVTSGSSTSVNDEIRADCRIGGVEPDDIISRDSTGYATTAPGAISCFDLDGSADLVVLPAAAGRPEVVVLSSLLVRNDEITRFDNAGVAIRTLAGSSRLLWYVPDHRDTPPSVVAEEEPSDIPAALGPLTLLGFFGLLALMFWRGRRFGPLVTEPLPAVVKAIETTQARGRLYHRARADGRAAEQLRAHTVARLGATLGLPVDTRSALGPDRPQPIPVSPSVFAIADAAAAASGRDPRLVHRLLTGPLPATEDDLVAFVTDLTALEKEVRLTP